jgi:DNA-binding LacI/PurR family transcriptional regulator
MGYPPELEANPSDPTQSTPFLSSSLTTATLDFDVMARESLDILFARIRKTPGAVLRRAFRPEMIIRKSTAPPP